MLNENRIRSKIVKLNELYNINKFQLALRYKEMELKKISEQIGRRKSRNLFLKVRHKGPSLDSDIINRVKNIKKLKIINDDEDNHFKWTEKKYSIEEICNSSPIFKEYIEKQKNKEKYKVSQTDEDYLNADFQNFLTKLNDEFDKKNEKYFRENNENDYSINNKRKFYSYHSDKFIFNKNYNNKRLINKNKPIKLTKLIYPFSSENSFEEKKKILKKKNITIKEINNDFISKKKLQKHRASCKFPNSDLGNIEIINNSTNNNSRNNNIIIDINSRNSFRTVDSLTNNVLEKNTDRTYHKKNLSETDRNKYVSLNELYYNDHPKKKKSKVINYEMNYNNYNNNNNNIHLPFFKSPSSFSLRKKNEKIYIPKKMKKIRNFSEEKFLIKVKELENLKKINKKNFNKIIKDSEKKQRNELHRELDKVDFVTNNILKMLDQTTNYFSEKVDKLSKKNL